MADKPIYQSLLDTSNMDITGVFNDESGKYKKDTAGNFKQWINNYTRLNAFNMNNINKLIQGYGNWVGNTTFQFLADYLLEPIIVNNAGWSYKLMDRNAGGEVFSDYYENSAMGLYASAFGNGNKADTANQFVIGKYNENNPDSVFIVGWGTSDEDRKNIVTIQNDGRVQSETSPIESKDLVNKGHLDTELERVKQLNQWIGNLTVTSDEFDQAHNNANLKPLLTQFVVKNSPGKRAVRNGDLVTVTISNKKPTDPQYPEIWIYLEDNPAAPPSSGDWHFYSSQQELLNASKTVKGLVQIGDNINVTDGNISVPIATNSTFGVIKLGSSLVSDNGVIDVNPSVGDVPIASKSVTGIVRIGDNINVTSGLISVPSANKTTAGVVKIGDNLIIDSSGALTLDPSIIGGGGEDSGIKSVGDGLELSSSGVLSVPDATKSKKGKVQIGDNITVENGIISVTYDDIISALGFTPSSEGGGGGEPYVLPVATASRLGGVMIGANIKVDTKGTISIDASSIEDALGYVPASSASSGYVLPVATSSVLGGVMIGEGLSITKEGKISVTSTGQVGITWKEAA